jgi:hypothetical protein
MAASTPWGLTWRRRSDDSARRDFWCRRDAVGLYLARVPAYNAQDFMALEQSSFAPLLKDLTFAGTPAR